MQALAPARFALYVGWRLGGRSEAKSQCIDRQALLSGNLYGFAGVTTLEDIRAKDGNLSIPLYVAPTPVAEQTRAGYAVGSEGGLENVLADWLESAQKVRQSLATLLSKGD